MEDQRIVYDRLTELAVCGYAILTCDDDRILPEHFVSIDCRELWLAIMELRAEGRLTRHADENAVRILRELERRKTYDLAGGACRVAEAMEAVTHVEFADSYTERLLELHERRQAIEHANRIIRAAENINADIGDVRTLVKGVAA